ncbi:amino acid permease [Saccharopolyspora sp. TS4A08]|uniref:Amino acid permease n=1 Tax=Saccharopolyspora ipomoeae TaxID=3042027 RepID=A0ABT6PH95_9PSEU|nr:amino acid permease [Saccharopolyspora sp. TS4A08]MDI2027364.1 amino acid permease [Saccharopolyspora sp. TS4A08]
MVEDTAPAERSGLRRALSGRQVGMIAIGGAIGTGLFLGSGLAISIAGPAVIIAYAVAAFAALALAYALAEMIVVQPEAGGFGAVIREHLGGLPGFVSRWMYWAAQVVNIGSEVIAAGLYLQFWYPQLPLWIPVVGFSVVMLAINLAAVRFFGEFEYWFAMIKVVTIVVFVGLGIIYILFGLPGHEPAGVGALTEHGGFLPNGLGAVWLALTVVTFSYLGTEAVSMTAAESRDPARDVPRAARSTVLRLALFYVMGMLVVVSILPWNEVSSSEDVTESPFVRLFSMVGVPAAAGIMNFVVLTAALSAMNTNLYLTARMTHSLALDGYAPKWFARVSANGVPRRALVLSAAGLALAAALAVFTEESAFPLLIGLALFAALLVWLMIFGSHLVFRSRRAAQGLDPSPVRLPGAPVTTVLAMLFVAAVLLTTPFTEQFNTAWKAGVPFLVVLAIAYYAINRKQRA